MMEWIAPVLLGLLFILFGLSQRGRSAGGCGACTGEGTCEGKVEGKVEGKASRECARSGAATSSRRS